MNLFRIYVALKTSTVTVLFLGLNRLDRNFKTDSRYGLVISTNASVLKVECDEQEIKMKYPNIVDTEIKALSTLHLNVLQ